MVFTHVIGKIVIFSLLSGYCVYWIYTAIKLLGPYKIVYNHVPGPCTPVKGVEHGSEDIQMLPNGIALISSGLQLMTGEYEQFFVDRKVKGQILAFDFKKPTKKPVSLKLNGFDSTNFNPHGLSIWNDKKNGKIFVYIINHFSPTHDAVEKFLYVEKDAALVHQKSIQDIHFHLMNDLVVVGEDEFYATNYHYIHHKLGISFELLAIMKWGSIVYFDGNESKYVERDLYLPNGINVSPDHKFLYLAHIHSQEVVTYRILHNRDLDKMTSFKVNTNLDNLDVDPATGDIWIGAHPIGYKAMLYMKRPDPTIHTTPSQVLHVKVQAGYPVAMTEVYADDGILLQGSSIAVHHKNAMLIGTVHNGLMYCEIRYMQ